MKYSFNDIQCNNSKIVPSRTPVENFLVLKILVSVSDEITVVYIPSWIS